MNDLPKGFAIVEGKDDFGPVFTLRKGDTWLDEDFDRERLVAFAHHLAKPKAGRKVILDTLRLAEEELEGLGRATSPAGKRVRSLIDVMFAEEVPATGGRS